MKTTRSLMSSRPHSIARRAGIPRAGASGRKFLGTLIAAVLVVGALQSAHAAPTCPDEVTRPACGNRIIAPPLQSVTFMQFELEYTPVLNALETLAPGILKIDTLGNMIGRPELKSADGHDIYVIKITDESVTTPKRQVAISLSVHANESAGREGGLRYVEDLARWWTGNDKQHLLYAGDVGIPLSKILAETEIYISVLNPDGWADGDFGTGPTYSRGNGHGVDLNRQFPTIGWSNPNYKTLNEPEAQGWEALVSSLPNLTTATDIHGELTSANDAFSDIMYPAGQWDAERQAQELQFAEHMNRTVERKFQEEGVVLQTLFDLAGDSRPMKPANFATAYDVVGYDDSGFMGDWFVKEGAVELDVENFLSHTVPNNNWFAPLEQAHVAAVKGNIEATIAESMITNDVTPDLDLGSVAYVFDPARISRDASSGKAAYDVSRMDYFVDLAEEVATPVEPLTAEQVVESDLASFDSLVLADLTVPGGAADERAAYIAALDKFARDGGQLVLTDRSIQLVTDLAGFGAADLRNNIKYQAGHVDFGSFDHRWEKDLSGVASQTYYAVPLGYRSGSSIREAPHYGVTATAWSAKGGVTAGTIDNGATVNLGELKHGNGSIAIFGAILPTQTTTNPHNHGLTDYAVSVAGGEVLHSILEYRRAG